MFGPPGRAYVYLIYGMYDCLNVVTDEEGYPSAVLIRALEPVLNLRQATDGPGRLTRAMKIDRRHNGADLRSATLFIAPPDRGRGRIATSARVGVDYAGEWARHPWRFFEVGNASVSRRDGIRAAARVENAIGRAMQVP